MGQRPGLRAPTNLGHSKAFRLIGFLGGMLFLFRFDRESWMFRDTLGVRPRVLSGSEMNPYYTGLTIPGANWNLRGLRGRGSKARAQSKARTFR